MGEMLGNPAIAVSDSSIVLRNALVKGARQDITIPRAEDGTILLNWPKKPFRDYKVMSLVDLIQYTKIESALAKNLRLMNSSGFFNYWDGGGENPWDCYTTADILKSFLFEGPDPENGISFEAWLKARMDFMEMTAAFLDGGIEEAILYDYANNADVREFVASLFRVCREQFNRMRQIRSAAAVLDGAFCIIGSNATSMSDEGHIAFEEHYPNVGIYAVTANMILSGEFVDDAPRSFSFAIAIIFSLALAFVINRLNSSRSLLAGFLALAFCIGADLLYFMIAKRYVPLAFPLVSLALTFLSLSGLNFIAESRRKSYLKMAFSRYLSPVVIDEIIADPSKLNLGGEKREMTAFFSDIQGFSSIAERLDPAHLVNLLNIYLTEMSDIIMANRGTIDKYEGDAVIAFFGAPLYMKDHAARACLSALAVKQAENFLNKKIMEEGLSDHPLATRIGINTGEMVVGNMGTTSKMDYTIMGSAVNIASRLEGVNKQYGTWILASEETVRQANGLILARRLDRVRVVGINEPVQIYELAGLEETASAGQRETIRLFHDALVFFEARNWPAAESGFQKALDYNPQDSLSGMYLERCRDFQKNAPSPDWDGVFNLSQK
jgi:adenylate cyclase